VALQECFSHPRLGTCFFPNLTPKTETRPIKPFSKSTACVASQECQLQSHPCRLLLFEILIEMLKQSSQNQGENVRVCIKAQTRKRGLISISLSQKKKL
jgi:hypothetical protein